MSDCVWACFLQTGTLLHIFKDQKSLKISREFMILCPISGIEAEIAWEYHPTPQACAIPQSCVLLRD